MKGPVHIVGLGRLGGALRLAWGAAGMTLTEDLSTAAAVVLTVPDDAIEPVAEGLKGRLAGDAVLLHCAGALEASILTPSGARHLASMHPAQTAPDPTSGAAALRGAWAAVEGTTQAAVDCAETLAIAAGLQPVRVRPESKALWHAAAVLASNDLVALLHLVDRLLIDHAGVPEGVRVLLPLVRATLDNVEAKGLRASLTGPVARGDQGTLARHRAALDALDAPDVRAAYDTLAAAAEDLVRTDPEG